MHLLPHKTNDLLDFSIHRFEQALEARPLAINPAPHRRALLALDGSNQDPTVLGLAQAIIPALGQDPRFEIVLASESGASPGQRASLDQARTLLGSKLHRVHESDPTMPAFRQILEAAQKADADWIIVPAPFLRDLDELGADSVGTVLDMLLARFAGTLLVVRVPQKTPGSLLHHWHWPLFPQQKSSAQSADSIGALLQTLPVNQLVLHPVADAALLRLAGQISEQSQGLKEALQMMHAALVVGIQRFCQAAGRPKVHVQPLNGGLPEIMDHLNRFTGLVTTQLAQHPQPEAMDKVRQIILHSANPILVTRR